MICKQVFIGSYDVDAKTIAKIAAKKYGFFLISLQMFHSSYWPWLLVLSGCTVNPVTGQNQFNILSTNDEIQIGEQQYLPARQSQGGDYVVHREVNDYINEVGQKLARVSDRKDLPYEFAVINNGTANAWALPGGQDCYQSWFITIP